MYETKQKTFILNILKENKDKHLTIEEIYDLLKENNYSVSIATIYRYLEKLVSTNIVRKYNTSHTEKATFQYIDEDCKKENHIHLICLKCNKLIHLNCHEMSSFIHHFEEHHDFKIIPNKVVYYGYCNECK